MVYWSTGSLVGLFTAQLVNWTTGSLVAAGKQIHEDTQRYIDSAGVVFDLFSENLEHTNVILDVHSKTQECIDSARVRQTLEQANLFHSCH